MTEPNFDYLDDAAALANSIMRHHDSNHQLDCAMALCGFAKALVASDADARQSLGYQMLKYAHEQLPNLGHETGQA